MSFESDRNGCGYVFQDTRQVKKQLAPSTEIFIERGKNPRQAGEWVCILLAKPKFYLHLASGYLHPCDKYGI
jgi:hypothetical protein